MKQKLLLGCCAVIVFSFVNATSLLVAAGSSDALLQGAAAEYASMRESLVKRYEDACKRGEALHRRYSQENKKDTIRNQVQAWQEIVTGGYTALFGFLGSEDFDKAHIINSDYYFDKALGMPMGYKNTWPAEIGPAWDAVQRCCNTADINECKYQILEKALPYYRDFANKIA